MAGAAGEKVEKEDFMRSQRVLVRSLNLIPKEISSY
jgi:hypothetical protein